MHFRMKPIEIEAIHWEGGEDTALLDVFCGPNWRHLTDDDKSILIWNDVDQAWLLCPVGHWVVRGEGSYEPCAPELFVRMFDPVEPSTEEPTVH